MAGAAAPLGTGVANVMGFAGVSLAEAISMALHQPAALLGLDPGRLERGQPADLVLFHLNGGFRVQSMIRGGQVVSGSPVAWPEPETDGRTLSER
jgi:N-acetylglucosamine-6-phosphate deacetylase